MTNKETRSDEVRDAILERLSEVCCRIDHGAESGGHLEFVRDKLKALAQLAVSHQRRERHDEEP